MIDFETERARHRLVDAEVKTVTRVGSDYVELELVAPEVAADARPGQFVHVRCRHAWTPLLRRPLSLLAWDSTAGAIWLLIQVVGEGTRLLAETTPGQRLSVLGPLGNWFVPAPRNRHLLVCGGVGVAPLLPFCRQLVAEGVDPANVAVLYGAATQERFCRLDDFQTTGCTVRLATDDGSRGHHGFVTDLLEEELARAGADCAVYACGPTPMMRRAAQLTRGAGVPCRVSLESRMGCGLGVCLGCVVQTRPAAGEPKYKRVCRDGPVFDAADLVWEAVLRV